jgi:predicted RNase H-like HicB family nuclease
VIPAGSRRNVRLVARLEKRRFPSERTGTDYEQCPELEGCQSQGLTLEAVMANIKEAVELYLEICRPMSETCS